jgi:hypothetical protein
VKRLKPDRISYSSKTALVVQHAIEFNLEVELKNIILLAFRYFGFLHSQGHSRRFDSRPATSSLPPETDIVRGDRHVSNVPAGEVGGLLPLGAGNAAADRRMGFLGDGV